MAKISLSWTQMSGKPKGSTIGRLETNELYTNIKKVADGVSGSTWSWSDITGKPSFAPSNANYEYLKYYF